MKSWITVFVVVVAACGGGGSDPIVQVPIPQLGDPNPKISRHRTCSTKLRFPLA